MRKILMMTAASVLGFAAAAVAEPVENPEYTNWAQFKPGAMSKWQMTMDQGGQQIQSTIVSRLQSLEDDQAVIVMEVSMQAMGQNMTMPPQERTVQARIDPSEIDPALQQYNNPDVEKGAETLTVNGKQVETEWFAFDTEQEGTKATGKAWVSKDVPGFLVKMEGKTEGDHPGTQKMELVEFTTE